MQNVKPAIAYYNNPRALWSVESILCLMTISSFYSGESSTLRTTLQIGAMLGVTLIFGMDYIRGHQDPTRTNRANLPAYMLFAAFAGMFLSFAFSLPSGLSTRDIGLFYLQGVIAPMIIFSPRNSSFAYAVGTWAIPFALVDALVNFAGVLNLIDIQKAARIIDGTIHYSYSGLSGNLLAAGFVAFIAICRLVVELSDRSNQRVPLALMILVILLSIWIIEARRYTGLTAFALVVFAGWRIATKIGFHWLSIFISGTFLFLNFNSVGIDQSNSLRAELLKNGVDRALEHPLLGAGPRYQELDGLKATFEDLAYAGVTESHFLDRVISYGGISAFALLVASLSAIAIQRNDRPDYMTIVLMCLVAEQFIGNSLSSLSGTFLLFGCLGGCLRNRQANSKISFH